MYGDRLCVDRARGGYIALLSPHIPKYNHIFIPLPTHLQLPKTAHIRTDDVVEPITGQGEDPHLAALRDFVQARGPGQAFGWGFGVWLGLDRWFIKVRLMGV